MRGKSACHDPAPATYKSDVSFGVVRAQIDVAVGIVGRRAPRSQEVSVGGPGTDSPTRRPIDSMGERMNKPSSQLFSKLNHLATRDGLSATLSLILIV
jgi:hypothetical protein